MKAVKLLLDENLSPTIALQLREEGVDVVHTLDRGLNGATDQQVFMSAFKEDRILVTINIGDFEKIAQKQAVHGGLVFVREAGLLRGEQLMVIRKVLSALEQEYGNGRDMLNRVMRITTGEPIVFEDLPPASQP